MALTGNITVARRGPARGDAFAYAVASGKTIFVGALCCINAAGNLVRPQDSGALTFVGLAMNTNLVSATPVTVVTDTYALTVPSASFSNINAPVYATDDGTLTLTQPGSGFTGIVGYLAGIDNGQTYVKLQGH